MVAAFTNVDVKLLLLLKFSSHSERKKYKTKFHTFYITFYFLYCKSSVIFSHLGLYEARALFHFRVSFALP